MMSDSLVSLALLYRSAPVLQMANLNTLLKLSLLPAHELSEYVA